MIYRLLPLVVVPVVIWFVWVCVLHVPRDQHVYFDCPANQTAIIDGRKHLCTYVTEDELRCYPMMCRQ
jgi:hypothetical protein